MSPSQPDVISAQPGKVPSWAVWITAVAVVAALAAVVIAEVGHSRPASRLTACGPGQAPGYGNHHSYPPGIPTVPPFGTHIVRCFASAAQAAGQGFPAAAPAGTLIVGGVFLEPTGSLTRRQCTAVARALGYAVPCPEVAPVMMASPPQLPNCTDNGGCSMGKAGFEFAEQNFAVPRHYHGMNGPTGYFALLASRNARLTDQCPSGSPIRRVRIGADRAAFYRCPLYFGNEVSSLLGIPPVVTAPMVVVLTWAHQGISVEVSFLSGSTTNIDLDLSVARHLSWVTPAS